MELFVDSKILFGENVFRWWKKKNSGDQEHELTNMNYQMFWINASVRCSFCSTFWFRNILTHVFWSAAQFGTGACSRYITTHHIYNFWTYDSHLTDFFFATTIFWLLRQPCWWILMTMAENIFSLQNRYVIYYFAWQQLQHVINTTRCRRSQRRQRMTNRIVLNWINSLNHTWKLN